MKWIRWLAAAYFAVALYGAAQAEDAPLSVTLYKTALLVGIIVVLLAWDFIFNGNWNKPRKARSATRMICMITDSQGENESDILAPVRHEAFEARTLAGDLLLARPAPAGGWSHALLCDLAQEIEHLTGEGADAYVGAVWVGSTEV
jgi:hypothetical protein